MLAYLQLIELIVVFKLCFPIEVCSKYGAVCEIRFDLDRVFGF